MGRKRCRKRRRARCLKWNKRRRRKRRRPSCVTTKNIPCVFPFTYKGKKYYKCTNKNYGKKLWCATTAIYKKGKWGRCKPGCKATGTRIPKRCTRWFDGCNVCRVQNGRKLGCTRKACRHKKRAKCVRYRKVKAADLRRSKWHRISGRLIYVTVSANGHVWGV